MNYMTPPFGIMDLLLRDRPISELLLLYSLHTDESQAGLVSLLLHTLRFTVFYYASL